MNLFEEFNFSDIFSESNESNDASTAEVPKVVCLKTNDKYLYRRAFSEVQLLDIMKHENFKDGYAYHFITGGDVDALSFLKIVLNQQNLDYLLFSTWCMARDDIKQITEWVDSGKIKRLDSYVGEIFPGSYCREFSLLRELYDTHKGLGRYAVFRNHSKIFSGRGEKFAFSIETSANINTNPRTENGCITIGREIHDFHKSFFDGIKSITKF